jgi:membrane associated rhomboid family serine protease
MKNRNNQHPEFTSGTIAYPLLFVLAIWVVFWVEIRFNFNFNDFGVQPWSLEGLRGIVFSPFIHGDIGHLASNSVPLLVLSMALFYFYRKISWKVLGFGLLLTGLLTWLIGDPGSTHIGASGVIYSLASFLFFKGIWSKNYRLTALSFIVVFLYGSFVWGLLPMDNGISWEGHLSGMITGIFFALIYRKYEIPVKKYEWENEEYSEEDDEFMKHFDEEGNFIETPPDEDVKITYHFKKKESDKGDKA